MTTRSGSWYALLSLLVHEPIKPLFWLPDEDVIRNRWPHAETIHSFVTRRSISSIPFAYPAICLHVQPPDAPADASAGSNNRHPAPHDFQHRFKPSRRRSARNPSTSPSAFNGVSLYQIVADMAVMKARLSVSDVLSRTDCVLAPSCEFDCEFGCEGSNGSINGGGRSGRVSSTPWDDMGDCWRDAC